MGFFDTDDILEARADAEALMKDTCEIRRPSGSSVDPETGEITPDYLPVYSGKCRLQSNEGVSADRESGQSSLTVLSRSVHIPAATVQVQDGDVVTMTASLFSPFLVNREFRVRGWSPESYASADRLPVEEVTT